MSIIDEIERMNRMVKSLGHPQGVLGEVQRLAAGGTSASLGSSPLMDLARQVTEANQLLGEQYDVSKSLGAALKLAGAPFSRITSGMMADGLGRTLGEFGSLDRAIKEARLIGALDLSPLQEDEDSTDEDVKDLAKAQLDEADEPEVVKRLELIEWVSVTVLDKIHRDPEIIRGLTPRQFEAFVATLVRDLGFEDVKLTSHSGDRGADVLATGKYHDIPVLYAFQCKRYKESNLIGPEVMRSLLGTVNQRSPQATMGVLVTTSSFSPGAHQMIVTEPRLDGKDFDGIVKWLQERGAMDRHGKS